MAPKQPFDLSTIKPLGKEPAVPPPHIIRSPGGITAETCSRCGAFIEYTRGGIREPICPNCGPVTESVIGKGG